MVCSWHCSICLAISAEGSGALRKQISRIIHLPQPAHSEFLIVPITMWIKQGQADSHINASAWRSYLRMPILLTELWMIEQLKTMMTQFTSYVSFYSSLSLFACLHVCLSDRVMNCLIGQYKLSAMSCYTNMSPLNGLSCTFELLQQRFRRLLRLCRAVMQEVDRQTQSMVM